VSKDIFWDYMENSKREGLKQKLLFLGEIGEKIMARMLFYWELLFP